MTTSTLSADVIAQLSARRDELRAKVRGLREQAQGQRGAPRAATNEECKKVDAEIHKINLQLRGGHSGKAGKLVPAPVWKALWAAVHAGDEFLFGDLPDKEAGDQLERALDTLDRLVPGWRKGEQGG